MFARFIRAALASLVACASVASAQVCTLSILTSEPGQGVPGADWPVSDMVPWDPDGPGPQPDLLIAVGLFDQLGSLRQNAIGAWDGSTWISLGAPNQSSTATAAAVYNNRLIIGGNFAGPGFVQGKLIQYDGTTWSSLVTSGLGRIDSMTVWNGELIVAGSFPNVSGVPAVNIARWNGTTWSALGSGLVHADGTTQVFALTVHDGALYAGGRFTSAGGVPANGLARWDGAAWSAVNGSFNATVYDLASFQGSLYVAGEVVGIAGGALGQVVRFDGANWTTLVPSQTGTGTTSLHAAPTRLYMGGFGSGLTPAVRSFDGAAVTTITPVSSTAPSFFINAMTLFRGSLIVGGNFSAIGGRGAQHIARYTSFWMPMGSGFENGAWRTASIKTAVEDAQYLYVGGFFTGVNGQGAPNAARRTPAGQWISMGTPGGGINHMILWDHDGLPATPPQPTAALSYTPGSQAFPGVRRWDGATWVNVMPRIANTPGDIVDVRKIVAFDGDLAAIGRFNSIDGQPVSLVVRRRNGVWESLGSNLLGAQSNAASDLVVHQGALYVSGSFTLAGSPAQVSLARWNGLAWEAVLPASSTIRPVYLESFQGRLYMTLYDALASWDGQNVTIYPNSQFQMNPPNVLTVVDGELLLPPYRFNGSGITANPMYSSGNIFTAAKRPDGKLFLGGERVILSNQTLRAYTELTLVDDLPDILAQPPADAVVCPDTSFSLEVVVSASSPVTYQWQRNGVNLTDGRGMSGTRSSRLNIRHAYAEDSGLYQCVVQATCSGTISTVSRVNVNPLCTPACDDIDFNNNDVYPEEEDILAFFRVLAGGDCIE